MMHKVFISYHHQNDQPHKNLLEKLGGEHSIFIDASVDDIPDQLPDSTIREIIRDDYLRNSTVTIVLVGTETKRRKHVDWEIYSSMHDGTVNKKSGILVINLPSTRNNLFAAEHGEENMEQCFSGVEPRRFNCSREDYECLYPCMPERILDNLNLNTKLSVVPWSLIEKSPTNLQCLIDLTFRDRKVCKYDLSQPMKRANS